MKKKLYIIFFLFNLISISILAQPDQEKFLMANKLYSEENFQEAFKIYDAMNYKGFEILFNMGNCQYKLNKYAYAIAYWLKAKKYASFDDFSKIENNIEQAYKKLEKQKKSTLFSKFSDVSLKYLSLFSIFLLQLIFLISWFLIVLFWKKLVAKHHRYLVLLFVINGLTLSCVLIKYFSQPKNYAIIVEHTKIFAGPDKSFHIVDTFDLIDEVKIIEKKEDWVKIKRNNILGWVPTNALVIV